MLNKSAHTPSAAGSQTRRYEERWPLVRRVYDRYRSWWDPLLAPPHL
jgi:hypothetical protein